MTTEDKLQEFAFYALYKTTPSKFEHATINEKIKICANIAYFDFCRTINYEHFKNENEKYTDSKWKEEVSKLIHLFYYGKTDCIPEFSGMIRAIENLIKSNDATAYNEEHKKICHELTKIESPILKNKLSIGQAQKWVNMTVKHLWLNGLVKCDASFLHVPIDNYILGELYKESEKIDLSLEIKKEVDQYKVKQGGKFISWSQISDYDTCYKSIQEDIKKISKEKLTPIEWEYDAWLTVAQSGKA